MTSGFSFAGQKSSIKASALSEKWDTWKKSQLSFPNETAVEGKTVVLIDDKYQSGVTIQYVAMILQRAGVRDVYGLSFVKTLRDTDNT